MKSRTNPAYAALISILILNTVVQERTGSSQKDQADRTKDNVSTVSHEALHGREDAVATRWLSHVFSHSTSSK